jgi:hypothetical protein
LSGSNVLLESPKTDAMVNEEVVSICYCVDCIILGTGQ